MKLTEQQFLDSLNADQAAYFNARLIEIRDEFQASYAASVADVSAAKDHLLATEKQAHSETMSIAATVPQLTKERDKAIADVTELQSQVGTIPELLTQITELTVEIDRMTALVPLPLCPREITAEEFFSRLSTEDVMAIMANQDPRVVLAVVRLFVRSEAIDLDSDIIKGLIQGLVESGVPFDDADIARIFA